MARQGREQDVEVERFSPDGAVHVDGLAGDAASNDGDPSDDHRRCTQLAKGASNGAQRGEVGFVSVG